MKDFITKYWKTLVLFGIVGLVGGFFTGIYALDSYPAQMQQEILSQGITKPILGLVSAVQSTGYGVVLGAVGIFLAGKTGLWKDEITIAKKPLMITVAVSAAGGLCLILPDILLFGKYSQVIMDSYAVKPSVPFMLAAVLYGGVIEEVMMRLFMMSLVVFILHKIFGKKAEYPATGILMAANVVAALLFAAGHLPATAATIGITPVILIRCFLLNGGFGLLFGWLYRKYGLRYAMIAHGGCHVVSKLIWILFI